MCMHAQTFIFANRMCRNAKVTPELIYVYIRVYVCNCVCMHRLLYLESECAGMPRCCLNAYEYTYVYMYVNVTAGQSKLSFLKNKIDKLCKNAKVPSELELSIYLNQDPEREQLSPEVHTYIYTHVL